jgi:hypothetical protein
MNHELHEAIISLKERFMCTEHRMDIVHQAWPAAVRERDFDRQSSLDCPRANLIPRSVGGHQRVPTTHFSRADATALCRLKSTPA